MAGSKDRLSGMRMDRGGRESVLYSEAKRAITRLVDLPSPSELRDLDGANSPRRIKAKHFSSQECCDSDDAIINGCRCSSLFGYCSRNPSDGDAHSKRTQ